MNSSNPRRFALALIIALHGVATLCAPAMHRHEAYQKGLRSAEGEGERRGGDGDGDARTHSDCSACRFIAQGRLGVDRAEVRRAEGFVAVVADLNGREWTVAFVGSTRSRGPPRG